MKKTRPKIVLATGIYGVFMLVFLLMRNGFPGGTAPAAIASVIYVSLLSILLRKGVT
jgi:hypothetical protein